MVILHVMWAFDTKLDRRTPGAGLLAPLNVTAYVAWLAAAESGLLGQLGDPLLGEVRWVLGIFTLMGFLGAFCTRAILEDRNASGGLLGGSVVVQAVLAPLSLWIMRDHLQAILLVLVAAQLAALRDRRVAMLALTVANCA